MSERTLDEIIQSLSERVDPDDFIKILEPDIVPLLDACEGLIANEIDKFNLLLDELELEEES